MTIKRLIHFWFRSILLLLLVSSFLFVVFFGQLACQHVHGGKGNLRYSGARSQLYTINLHPAFM